MVPRDRSAGRRRAEQRRLQPRPQRRPGARRRDRRGRRRRGRLRRQRGELFRDDLRAVRWRPDGPVAHAAARALGAAMGAGLRYVAMSPNIAKVLLRGFLFGLAAIAVLALMPVVARDLVQGGPLTYGLLLGAFGVGAVGGAFLSARLRERFERGDRAPRLCRLRLCAGVGALSPTAWLTSAGCCSAARAGCWRCRSSTSPCSSRRRAGSSGGPWRSTRRRLRRHGARQLALGRRRRSIRPAAALLAAAAAMLAGGPIGLPLPLPDRGDLNLDPLNRWREPQLALDLEPRSGPIVSIEYASRGRRARFLPRWRNDGASAAATARGTGRCCATSRIRPLDRALPHPDLDRLPAPQPAPHPSRRRDRRPPARPAPGRRPPRVHRMIERQTRWGPDEPVAKVTIDPH